MKKMVLLLAVSICLFGCTFPNVKCVPLLSPGSQLGDCKITYDDGNIYMGRLAGEFGSGLSKLDNSVVEVGATEITYEDRKIIEYNIKITNLQEKSIENVPGAVLVAAIPKEWKELNNEIEKITNKMYVAGKKMSALWKQVLISKSPEELHQLDDMVKEGDELYRKMSELEGKKATLSEIEPLRLLSPIDAVHYQCGETSEEALIKSQSLASMRIQTPASQGPASAQTFGQFYGNSFQTQTTYNRYYGSVDAFAGGFASGFNNAVQWAALARANRAVAIAKAIRKRYGEALRPGVLLPRGSMKGKMWSLPGEYPIALCVAVGEDTHCIFLHKVDESK